MFRASSPGSLHLLAAGRTPGQVGKGRQESAFDRPANTRGVTGVREEAIRLIIKELNKEFPLQTAALPCQQVPCGICSPDMPDYSKLTGNDADKQISDGHEDAPQLSQSVLSPSAILYVQDLANSRGMLA